MDFEIERRCLYEKKNGIIQLSPSHLIWTPDSAADGNELQIALTSITRHDQTKQGSAKKAMIRLTCSDRNPVKLDFAQNWADRDAVRHALIRVLRGEGENSQTGGGGSSATTEAPSASPAKPISHEELKKRQKLLRYPDVYKSHLKLVCETRCLTDEEFWNGIKYKFTKNGDRKGNPGRDQNDEDLAGVGVHKGVPSSAYAAPSDSKKEVTGLDPESWENGIPTPSQRHRIFILLPFVARAYPALVPSKMKEEQFWKALSESSMASKLSKQLRVRQRGNTSNKADTIFAAFQSSENTVANRETKAREEELDPSLDFRRFDDHRAPHVMEGHAAVGDAPRITTRPGSRGLPSSSQIRIMRDVNRHARMVVDETCTVNEGNIVAPGWQKDPSEKGTILDDLVEAEPPRFATISSTAIERATPVFHSEGGSNAASAVSSETVNEFVSSLDIWSVDSSSLLHPQAGTGKVLSNLLVLMRP